MKEIVVNASKTYSVFVGSNLIDQTGSYLRNLKTGCKVAIISDSNVWPLYGERVCSSLCENGFIPVHFVFSAGESSKNAATYLEILHFLAENHITRSDILIALGGGVVGDITGFSAATFLRGVGYIQIPTTLLAMVDSSVGGKTAIDLPEGKNLVGAFYQPSLVLADVDTLSTLPQDIFRDGCAEVIKYGVLYDRELFDHLAKEGLSFSKEEVICRCVGLKRDVVAEDEFDTGSRQKLNLGHTFGHGVEAHSDFKISHGKAVAIGMSIVVKASTAFGFCLENTADEVTAVLKKFGLPVTTEFTSQNLFEASLSDKKRSGSTVNLIIPKSIGNCMIYRMPIDELKSFIKAGL